MTKSQWIFFFFVSNCNHTSIHPSNIVFFSYTHGHLLQCLGLKSPVCLRPHSHSWSWTLWRCQLARPACLWGRELENLEGNHVDTGRTPYPESNPQPLAVRRQSQPLHIVFLYCRVCRIICKSNQVVYSHESSLWKQQSPCGGHYGFAGQRHFWSGLFTDLEVIFLYLFSLALSFNLLRIWWVGKTLFYWSQKQSKRAKKKSPHSCG